MRCWVDETGWLAHWRGVYAGLVLIGSPAERHRATPSDAHLDRLDTRFGCRLPASYRAFVKVFGPGSIARSFTIYAPGYRGANTVSLPAALGANAYRKRNTYGPTDTISPLAAPHAAVTVADLLP